MQHCDYEPCTCTPFIYSMWTQNEKTTSKSQQKPKLRPKNTKERYASANQNVSPIDFDTR